MNYRTVQKSQESTTMYTVPLLNAFREVASGGSRILHIAVSKAGRHNRKEI